MNTTTSGHALVLGASMAGLLAGAVLADHVGGVTIIDRDRLPATPQLRKGTPQARHVHTYWLGGLRAVERMLPGFAAELTTAGAIPVHLPTDMRWLAPPGWVQQFPASTQLLSASRPLVEWTVRRRVAALPNVRILDGHDVVGLRAGTAGAIDGVFVKSRDGGERTALAAGLVIDACGRGSGLPDWLAALCRPRPAESTVDGHLGYASRYFEIPPGVRDWQGIYVQPAPPRDNRGGIMFPIEGGRWVLTLIGGGGDHPPTDEAGFAAFARSLRSGVLYEAVADATAISPIAGYRRTANHRRHYERTRGMPDRLLVLGDSLCAFNPVYGQGMTVAALQAEELAGRLRRRRAADLDGFTGPAQRAMATIADGAWMVSTGEDLRYPNASGAAVTAATRFMHWYMDRVLAAAAVDRTANTAFLRVLNMIDSPQALFRPGAVARVLRPGRAAPVASSRDDRAVATPVVSER